MRSFKNLIIYLPLLMIFVSGCSEDKTISTLPPAHPSSWMNDESADFHGKVVLDRGTENCVVCHGTDFDGGETKISCVACHLEEGACASCHGGDNDLSGAPPKGLEGETESSALAVGAHTAHLNSTSSAEIPCQTCHIVPVSILDSLHLDINAVPIDSIAEINFSSFTSFSEAVWDRDSATCSDTYCHGNFNVGNQNNKPIWNATNQAACGSCHDAGLNPGTLGWKHEFHVGTANISCDKCHGTVFGDSLQFIDATLHVNGVIDTLVTDTAFCNTCHGSGGGGCTLCHGGTDNQTGAPPLGLEGETATTDLAVGAHTIHLDGGTQADGFSCESCHIVPLAFDDAGHLGADSIAELTWSGLSGGSSSWNRVGAECNNTYCHGNFAGGDVSNVPVWTGGSGEASCGSCHDVGSAPATLGWKHDFHVNTAGISCDKCHESVVNNSNQIIDLSLHVNGVIDTLVTDTGICNTCHGSGGGGCTLCHGGTDNQTGAPPLGLEGETATTDLAVGAHTIHLDGGTQADGFSCESCHIVPLAFDDAGHLGADSIAELTWSGLSGGSSSWNRVGAECNNTYCHGNFAGGDVSNVPVWTGGSGEASCGSCHDVGSAPATLGWKHDFHVNTAGISCDKCHESVVNNSNQIIDLSLHVNGVIDTLVTDTAFCNTCHGSGGGGCTLCHGGTDNQTGAPPLGLEGETATTDLAVGAHTIHLDGGTQADGFSCESCHIVPLAFDDAGHLGADSIAELTWSGLSGGSSSWNRVGAECNNTYCHGNFAGGDVSNVPVWTGGSGEASCGSCHDVGSAPATLGWKHDFHVNTAGISCDKCHESVVNNSNQIIDLSLHVNGVIDTLVTDTAFCNTCHGSGGGGCTLCHGGTDNQTGAPPLGLEGETATTDLAVGAHTIHLDGGTQADGFSCESCHIVPLAFDDAGHLGADSIAELTWSGLSGGSSSWNRVGAECNNTYCHGNFAGGDVSNVPVWTGGSGEASCGSCHDVGSAPATLGWKHDFHVNTAGISCDKCHESVVNNSNQIIDLSLHVNGVIDTLVTDTAFCNTCHGSGGGGCTLCHGGTDNQTGAPPLGLEGETATTDLAVGAHTIHLDGGTQADGFSCESCHIVPLAFDDAGHLGADSIAELTWSGLSGGSSSWNRVGAECNNTYCHGNFAGGDVSNVPVWTGGSSEATCGSCHDVGNAPATLGWKHDVHVRIFFLKCNDCHDNVVDDALNITSLDLHVNGNIDTLTADTTTCGLCHSDNQPSCAGCHGGIDNSSGAPPRGLRNEMLTTDLAVGAHTAHVDGSVISDGVECTECHIVPVYFGDPGHYDTDSIAEMTWGPLAGASSSWNRSTHNCDNTYCHGNFSGGFNDTPNWTGSNQASCGSCHDVYGELNSLSGEHKKHVVDKNIECSVCHSTVVNSSRVITGLDLHINGTNEINMTSGTNAVYSGGECTGTGCHGRESW